METEKFLCGFQRKQMRWTGFGGKALDEETVEETAVRETVEELFEVNLSSQDLHELIAILEIGLFYSSPGYSFYVLPFASIFTISEFLAMKKYTTTLYVNYPICMEELITKRITANAGEIEKIQLFTFADILDMKAAFDPNLLKDLHLFIL